MLEIACYADVQCHAVEYPLRVATLDYVRDNLDSPDVRSAVRWIASSYDSQLPMDAPGDTEGHARAGNECSDDSIRDTTAWPSPFGRQEQITVAFKRMHGTRYLQIESKSAVLGDGFLTER